MGVLLFVKAEGGTGRVGNCTADRSETSVFCTREDAADTREFGLTRDDIDNIIAFHNRVRAEANATNMVFMVSDQYYTHARTLSNTPSHSQRSIYNITHAQNFLYICERE